MMSEYWTSLLLSHTSYRNIELIYQVLISKVSTLCEVLCNQQGFVRLLTGNTMQEDRLTAVCNLFWVQHE